MARKSAAAKKAPQQQTMNAQAAAPTPGTSKAPEPNPAQQTTPPPENTAAPEAATTQQATASSETGAKEAPAQEAQVPAIPGNEEFTGYEEIDPSAFIIPRMKIVQPTSKEGTAGTFLMNLTGEEFSEIAVAVIKAARSRVMWDRDDNSAEEPLCRSFDGLVPDPSIDDPPSTECIRYVQKGRKRMVEIVCPNAKWGPGRERPPCDEVYNLLCVSLEENLPFWLSLTGASIKPVKGLISGIALRRKKLAEFGTTFTLEERKEPHRHFVLKYTPPRFLEAEMLETIAEFAQNLRDASFQSTIEAEEAAADSEDDKDDETIDVPAWAKEE